MQRNTHSLSLQAKRRNSSQLSLASGTKRRAACVLLPLETSHGWQEPVPLSAPVTARPLSSPPKSAIRRDALAIPGIGKERAKVVDSQTARVFHDKNSAHKRRWHPLRWADPSGRGAERSGRRLRCCPSVRDEWRLAQ